MTQQEADTSSQGEKGNSSYEHPSCIPASSSFRRAPALFSQQLIDPHREKRMTDRRAQELL